MNKPKKATKEQIDEAKRELKELLKKQYPFLDFDIELIDNANLNYYENMQQHIIKKSTSKS